MGVKICVRVFDQHFVVEKWIYFMSDTCLLKNNFHECKAQVKECKNLFKAILKKLFVWNCPLGVYRPRRER